MRTLLALLFAVSLTSMVSGCSDDSQTVDDAGGPDTIAVDGATDITASDAGQRDLSKPDTSADATTHDSSTPDSALTPDLPGTDRGVDTIPSPDSAPLPDLGNSFAKQLAGIWLVGWAGGLNHYSWLKLTPTSDMGGTAIILDGAKLNANAPYWGCSGATTWNINSKPRTFQLQFPSPSCSGMKSTNLTFAAIKPATGGYPKGALELASVDDSGASGLKLTAYRFPASQCNTALTSCTDPL